MEAVAQGSRLLPERPKGLVPPEGLCHGEVPSLYSLFVFPLLSDKNLSFLSLSESLFRSVVILAEIGLVPSRGT